MEFIKIDSEVAGTGGSEVAFRVDRKVGMIAFVGEEWRNSGGSTQSIVVSELCKRKKISPVVLLIIAINSEILLQRLISSFCLSVSFRVIAGGEM
jgi:hypothetical protein